MIEINSAHFAAIALFRAKNDIRYYLNGVMLETGPNGAYLVATDGAALAVARVSTAALPDAQVLIGADIVATLAKQKNAIFVTMPEQGGKFEEPTKRKITVETTGASTMVFDEAEGIFPDWRRVAKHAYVGVPAFFAPNLVARVDDAARLIKGTKKGKSAAHIRPGGDGCGFATLDHDGNACAWVMPMRVDAEEMPACPAFIL